jgi:hypothetical protein
MTPPEVLYLCITPDHTPVVVLDEGTALYMMEHGQVYEAHLIADGSNGIDLRTAPALRIAALEAEVARLQAEVVKVRDAEAADVVAWLRADLPPPHLLDPYENGDVAIEWAANEIEQGRHRAGGGSGA